MQESSEYVVIGAGAIGSAAALHLARQGKSVVLLEQFELGHERGSSHGESRIIRYVYDRPLYVRMAKEAYPLWAEIERESGRSLNLKTGGIDLCRKESLELSDCVESLSAENISFECLDAKEIGRRFPQFRIGEDTIGLYQEDTGILGPSACVATMHLLCRRYGADIRKNFVVEKIEFEGTKALITGSAGQITAANLIICTGGWAGPLLASLGLDLPLTVSQEQYAFFKPKQEENFEPGRFPVFIERASGTTRSADGGIGFYGFPIYGHQGVKAALHQTGKATTAEKRDFEIDPECQSALVKRMEKTLPDAAGEILHSATCLYTNTPDQNFVMDCLPGRANVSFFAGCSGHSFKFAPLIGRLLVDLVEKQETIVPVEMFSARRFSG